jgi:hypothetical protein
MRYRLVYPNTLGTLERSEWYPETLLQVLQRVAQDMHTSGWDCWIEKEQTDDTV